MLKYEINMFNILIIANNIRLYIMYKLYNKM